MNSDAENDDEWERFQEMKHETEYLQLKNRNDQLEKILKEIKQANIGEYGEPSNTTIATLLNSI